MTTLALEATHKSLRACPRGGCAEVLALRKQLTRVEIVLWAGLALGSFGQVAQKLLLPLIGG